MKLLAAGRAADVYDLGDGTVLRRYREPFDTAAEAGFMERVRRAGLPVPAVVSAAGSEIVMERVEGVTMLEDLARRPWRLRRHADLLASLMQRMHTVASDGGQVLHGDFHPLNVIVSPRGPVIIDWTAARIGPWPEDVAMTWLIVGTSVPDGGRWQRWLAARFGLLFTRRFLSHFDLAPVREVLPRVAEQRLRDRHVTAIEAERVRRLVAEPEHFQ